MNSSTRLTGFSSNARTARLPILFGALHEAWCADTSSDPAWNPSNPALGQCAVTACLLQDIFGGELAWAKVGDGAVSHYWNLVPARTGSGTGLVRLDATFKQFPSGTMRPSPVTRDWGACGDARTYVLSSAKTLQRYGVLRQRFFDAVERREDLRIFERMAAILPSSHDRSTKVACIFVSGIDREILVEGVNRFPDGIDPCEGSWHQEPQKYEFMEHAERTAICNAARQGIALDGSTAYMRGWPCAECARAMVMAGVHGIVTANIQKHHRWDRGIEQGRLVLAKRGVPVRICTDIPFSLMEILRGPKNSLDMTSLAA